MARTGYNTTVAPTGATSTADLHTFLDSNLTTWSVGSIYTFGVTTAERKYYVLSHNTAGAEILVYQPNGTATTSDINSGILAAYRPLVTMLSGVLLTSDRPLVFAYSPGGGYDARLVAGDDPSTDSSFWPTDSSLAFPIHDYYESNTGDSNLYFLEESNHAELVVYGSRVTSMAGWGLIQMSDSLYGPTPGSSLSANGMWHSTPTAGTGSPRVMVESNFTTYDTGVPTTTIFVPGGGGLTGFVGTNQPLSDGTYITRKMGVEVASVYPVTLNADAAVECGRMTATYGVRIGPASQPYVHLYQDFLTPWANGLAAPSIS